MPQHLARHLAEHDFAPAYLVHGDEPLQETESVDLIRASARAAGCSERLVFDVEPRFDWQRIQQCTQEQSLFAARRLIEIRLGTRKPDKTGSRVLIDILSGHGADSLLLTMAKFDRNSERAAWFKAVDDVGVCVPVRAPAAAHLPKWIRSRAQSAGLTLTAEATELIALRSAGNLLAAAQELEKLKLLLNDRTADVELVSAATADSARFDVFKLVDALVSGQRALALRMVRGLREEGIEPVVVGWALNRELRTLAHMAIDVAADKSVQSVLNEHKVWRSRAAIVRQALARLPLARAQRLLQRSAEIDRLIKGLGVGGPWDELELLCLEFAGRAR